jgi:hypothetical protein
MTFNIGARILSQLDDVESEINRIISERDRYDRHRKTLMAEKARLIDALRQCRDYLSCIPESAAGGDDDAMRLVKIANVALVHAGEEP